MKLSQWAKEQGLTYKGAWRMWRAGQLPVPAEQLPTGTIIVKKVAPPAEGVALYARVSSSEQRREAEAQLGRLAEYARGRNLDIVQAVSEVGSGRNGHRPKLLKLLADRNIGTIVVEHRDRFMGFGAEYVEAALAAHGRRLVVVESSERKEDRVEEMFDVLTSFCTRRYGRRSARKKAKQALDAMRQ